MSKTDLQTHQVSTVQRWLGFGVLSILAIMPFHAFLAVSLGHLIGYQAVWQSWKEVLIIAMLAAAAWLMLTKRAWLLKWEVANEIAVSIIGLGLFLTVLYRLDLVTAAFGIKVTLVPLVLFLIAQLTRIEEGTLTRFVLWPSYVVAALAILQEYVLPTQWLVWLGYSEATIRPVQLVDPAVKSFRAFATLGGPNQLGAYLILPTVLGLAMFWRTKKPLYALGSLLTLTGVVLSFSRSAWLGLVVAVICSVFFLGGKVVRVILASIMGVAVLSFIVLNSALPHLLDNTQLQYYLLHGRYNEAQQVEGSDVGRNSAQQAGLKLVQNEPFGHGLGAAGPASFYAASPLITENWYLQIGIELGILGIGLFVVFFGDNLLHLVRLSSPLSLALAASVFGLSATAMFLHVWADSSLALIMFALLGTMRTKQA